MYGYIYFGQVPYAGVPPLGSLIPASAFVSYNTVATTFVTWQNTP